MREEVLVFPREMVQGWLDGIDVSSETKRAYRNGMRSLERFMAEQGIGYETLQEKDILAFKRHLEQHVAPETVSTYLIGVRSFFHWLDSPETPDVAARVKGAKKTHGFKKDILTPEQALLMLEHARGETAVQLRNFAMLNLMLRTGLRAVEVVRADKGDIRTEAGRTVLYVQGKGRADKDEFVVLTDEALAPIESYLETRPHTSSTDPLFSSASNRNKNGRLTTRTVSRVAKDAMRAIGLDDERHTAHSLRHTAVTYALLGGAAIEETQAMARHANINTTMIYSHHIDRIKNAAEIKIGQILDTFNAPSESLREEG